MELFCRLCMKQVEDGSFETINQIHIEILEVLLSELDLSERGIQAMCDRCANRLQECFEFKSTCLYNEDSLIPVIDCTGTKVDLRKFYLQYNKKKFIPEDESVCRLCMNSFKIETLSDANEIELGNMLQKCLPEVNMENTNEALVCKSCVEAVHENLNFVQMCLESERKTKCLKLKDISNNKNYLGDKKRKESLSIINDLKNLDRAKSSEKNSSARRKNETNPLFNVRKRSTRGLKCPVCDGIYRNKQILKMHQIVHKDPANLPSYRCDLCTFKTKYKVSLKEHSNVHKDRSELKKYKCDICPYEGTRFSTLNKHKLTHRDPSEMLFQCAYCTYATNRNDSFTLHAQIHDTTLQILSHECPKCPYKSRRKNQLQRHMIRHKDKSETEIFSCERCSYSTKWKATLKQHQLTHKKLSEVETFKCFHCPYEAKRKQFLIRHLLIHKEPSRTEWYTCDKCSFQTKNKPYAKVHALSHLDKSELPTYKCDVCDYTCTLKGRLSDHRKVHTNIRPHKCKICSVSFKTPSCLKRHMLTHAPQSIAAIFECHVCGNKYKRKDALQSHILTHDRTNLYVLRCRFCSFETKYPKSLRNHERNHQGL